MNRCPRSGLVGYVPTSGIIRSFYCARKLEPHWCRLLVSCQILRTVETVVHEQLPKFPSDPLQPSQGSDIDYVTLQQEA